VDAANDIAEFLTTRRAQITPGQPFELVLEGLAGALQLDDAQRAHLFDLARAASPVAPKRSRPAKKRIRPVVQRLLDQIDTAAIVSTVGSASQQALDLLASWTATPDSTGGLLRGEARES
jgi:hypothetical protein